MALQNPLLLLDDDILVLTGWGNQELRGAGTSLSPAEIELLVRIDAKSTVAEIRNSAQLLGRDATSEALRRLIRGGFADLASNQTTISLDFTEFLSDKPRFPRPKAGPQAKARASAAASELLKQGFFVRIARRRVPRKPPAAGELLTVAIIEDDVSLARFVRLHLETDGYATRVATNRAQIVAELSRRPLADLVLLDVTLPDADGFNVLLKMREHPALKNVPVIMLTARATREAVLNGLARGADGYITKPVDAETLLRAAKIVLGLPRNPFDRRRA